MRTERIVHMDRFVNIPTGRVLASDISPVIRRELVAVQVDIIEGDRPPSLPRRLWGALPPGYTFIRFSAMWHVYGVFTKELRERIRSEGSMFVEGSVTHALKSRHAAFDDLLIDDIDEASGPLNIGYVTVGTMQGLQVVVSAIRAHHGRTREGYKSLPLSIETRHGYEPPRQSTEDVSTEPGAHERAGTMGRFVNITTLEDEPLRRDTIIRELSDASVGEISTPGERPFGFVPPHYTFVRRIDEWTVHGLFPLDLVNLIGSDPACGRDKVRFFSIIGSSPSAFNYDLVEVLTKQALRAVSKTIQHFHTQPQHEGGDIKEKLKRERPDLHPSLLIPPERLPSSYISVSELSRSLKWIEGALKTHHGESGDAIQDLARRVSSIEKILDDKGISTALHQKRRIDFASIPPASSKMKEEDVNVNVSVAVGQSWSAVSGSGIATVANVLPPIRKGNESPDMVIVSFDGMLTEYSFPHPFVDLFVPVLDEEESRGDEE